MPNINVYSYSYIHTSWRAFKESNGNEGENIWTWFHLHRVLHSCDHFGVPLGESDWDHVAYAFSARSWRSYLLDWISSILSSSTYYLSLVTVHSFSFTVKHHFNDLKVPVNCTASLSTMNCPYIKNILGWYNWEKRRVSGLPSRISLSIITWPDFFSTAWLITLRTAHWGSAYGH